MTFLVESDGEQVPRRRTWSQLLDAGARRASALAMEGVREGEVVLLMDDTGPALVESFVAVTWLGAVPVVLAPRRGRDHQEFIAGVIRQTLAQRMLVGTQILDRSRDYLAPFSALLRPILSEVPDLPLAPAGRESPTAWLQFSSGSTRVQRGVIVSQDCLVHNLAALASTAGVVPGDVFVSWLPLFHDMGLVIGLFGPPAWNGHGVLFDPSIFAFRPATWLRLVSEHRGTLSAAPNFAYELCLQRIRDEELQGVQLDSWRYSWNGAEMVLPATVQRFESRFRQWGLRPNVVQPGYGAAEATLAITSHHAGDPLHAVTVSREGLAAGEIRQPAADEPGLAVASVGRPLPGTMVRVLDTAGEPLPDRRVGEIEVQGDSVCPGYIGAPDPTLLGGRWLSGDMGFLADGELFVTGRKKEVMIVNGRNIYPYDVEIAAREAAPEIVRRAAAFSIADVGHGTERVVVAVELHKIGALDEATRDRVRASVASACGTSCVTVYPVPFIPITTSGKIQRVRLRESYLASANATTRRAS